MTYLLDTHVLLWWLFNDRRLSSSVKGLLADSGNRIFVSSVSAWEIATKHRLGKLSGVDPLVTDIDEWIAKTGFEEMPIAMRHGLKAGIWPQPHRDPYDRMLAAQSAIEDVPLITSDRAFRSFGIRLVW